MEGIISNEACVNIMKLWTGMFTSELPELFLRTYYKRIPKQASLYN